MSDDVAKAQDGGRGCSKWDIWPLMMAVGFTCMAKNEGFAELILRSITIAALTYSISHRLTRGGKPK
jgi:hypothetical protein